MKSGSSTIAAYLVAWVTIFFVAFGRGASFVCAQEGSPKVATGGLNEFDLAQLCGEAGRSSDKNPLPRSRFGYVPSQTGQAPEFAYVTSRYYVQKGPYGDPQGCEFKRYLYRLDPEGAFKREELDEKRFAQIENDIRAYARSNKQLNGGESPSVPGPSTADSVGGCLFPISWYTIGDRDYALLSVAANGGIVNYVIPQYQRTIDGILSTCDAWGERHLTNSSITSSELAFLSINSALLFVESKDYQTGFLFKPGLDFQCVRGTDSFSRHILISRKAFDAEMRAGLENVLQKNSYKSKISEKGKRKMLSFFESVFLNQQLAALMARLTEDKGCK
ncbi:hypothetical protein QA640_10805 [Bradyrhizobium sp. CB82]|uniref:hypothetical protein n=1 Tax=Bradyrhizobium sp. CB82 TaxID=3039159 RepID=UPI0024B089A6|nr:hypothetical protein [Bradyrhizobium sp. CB82]WFU42893.1 hypothetical protein QA640_10805 [Bradyrhizobium sp. CB82]